MQVKLIHDLKKCVSPSSRHENPIPFGEIRRFETKIGDLRESCRSEEFLFWGRGGGSIGRPAFMRLEWDTE